MPVNLRIIDLNETKKSYEFSDGDYARKGDRVYCLRSVDYNSHWYLVSLSDFQVEDMSDKSELESYLRRGEFEILPQSKCNVNIGFQFNLYSRR
ncbi:hypothetical protein LIS04_215 [Listeria phage LIS04]|nr:hypothetical protein LIS04_215 [Listeria phage LIS04]